VPAYMPFLTVPGMLGRDTIQIEMIQSDGRWVYDLDALEGAYAAGGDLLILCNPHNPLGRVMEQDEMVAIAEIVERHGGRVFSDEIHAPLVYSGHAHVPYASVSESAAGHTITATSATKTWNFAGLKCAQVIISNSADRVRWEQMGELPSYEPSVLGVLASTVAFREGHGWLAEVLGYLDKNRKLLVDLIAEHLPHVGYTPPEGTYLAWLDCRALELPANISKFFGREAGVGLVPGTMCGTPGTGYVRLNFGTTSEILRRMVTQMGEAVQRHCPA
jgi:cystathionine beta-lyase